MSLFDIRDTNPGEPFDPRDAEIARLRAEVERLTKRNADADAEVQRLIGVLDERTKERDEAKRDRAVDARIAYVKNTRKPY